MAVIAGAASAQERSNVLVLVADDFGVDYMATYGGPDSGRTYAKTPTLDALATGGVLFRNAWAYALCSPTRAALMTGRYGFRTGVGSLGMGRGRGRRSSLRLRPEEVTLPELLDAADSGYAHALFGKWHLGNGQGGRGPNQAGWSHFAGLLGGGLFRGDNYYDWSRTVNGKTERCTEYTTTQITDDALAWIRTTKKPWVCVVNYNAPHMPFEEPPAHLHTDDLAADIERDAARCYRAMVEAMDAEIGRLLKSLGDARENTHVIFIGDNGTPARVAQTKGRRRAKGTAYEGGIRVPLIVAGPCVRTPGRSVEALVSVVDLFATIGELAGVKARSVVPESTTLDAVSFVPYLKDPQHAPLRRTMISELFQSGPESSGFVACRNDRYKLIRSFGGGRGRGFGRGPRGRGRKADRPGRPRDELYDLRRDPDEQVNLLSADLSETQQAAYDALVAAVQKLNRGGK